jgi:hypothetical protein
LRGKSNKNDKDGNDESRDGNSSKRTTKDNWGEEGEGKGGRSRFKKNRTLLDDEEGERLDRLSRSNSRPLNAYDELPVVTEYTKKLKEGIDIYKKKTNKLKKMEKDLGALGGDALAYDRLQMYLP